MSKKKKDKKSLKKVKNEKEKYNSSFQSFGTKNSTKGTEKDVTKRQKPTNIGEPNDIDIDILLKVNNLARIILTTPIEDMLKNGFDIKFYKGKSINGEELDEDKEIYDAVWEEIKKLKFINKLKDLLIQSRKYGYSLLYYITKEKNSETVNPLSNNYELMGLNVFDKYDIQKLEINKNKLSVDYNSLENPVVIKTKTGNINSSEQSYDIDTSRLSFSQGYTDRNNPLGISIFNSLMDTIVIVDTTEWSIAQLVYRANLLLYKTSNQNAEKIMEDGGIAAKEEEINASTLAVMGKEDEMAALNTTSGFSPEAFINTAITILSVHTNIPKQRLMGNTQGTLAGSEEDAKKYAEYLKRYFNTDAVPIIEEFLDKLLKSMGIENVYYEIILDSLLEVNEKEVAETEKIQAQAIDEKLKVINSTMELMNKVGLNPNVKNLQALISKIENGKELTGQDLDELFTKALKFSDINLEIEQKLLNINSQEMNMKQQALTTVSTYDFNKNKGNIAEFMAKKKNDTS